MSRFAMIVLLPATGRIQEFKSDLKAVCPEAECYSALTKDIRCGQDALAVVVPKGKEAVEFENLAPFVGIGYRVMCPLPIKDSKQKEDRVCFFSMPFEDDNAEANLLKMWELCQEAMADLSSAAYRSLHFAIYLDAQKNVVNFQAYYSAEEDYHLWQSTIGAFCQAFIQRTQAHLKICFCPCQLFISPGDE